MRYAFGSVSSIMAQLWSRGRSRRPFNSWQGEIGALAGARLNKEVSYWVSPECP